MAPDVFLSEEQKTHKWRKSYPRLVGIAYLFQGIYMAGIYIYALAMLAGWGVPVKTQASVIAFIALPLYLKVVPGLLSDRVPVGRWGRRKPYIFFGGLLYLPGFILLITTRQFGPAWLGAIFLILVAWMFVDTVLDALIVDITPSERASQVQGSAWGSRMLGTAIGGLLTPLLGPIIGWTPVLVILGVSAVAQSLAAFFLPVIPVSVQALRRQLPLSRVFRESFGRPLVWLSIFFFLLYPALGISRLVNVYLLTGLGWNSSPETMRTYGLLTAAGTLAGACGALLAGRMPPKWLTSFKFYLFFLGILWILALPWLAVYFNPQNLSLIFIAQILLEGSYGVLAAIFLALTMRVCPRSIEGFTFALLVSVRSFATNALGPKAATAFSDQLGIVPSFYTLIPYGLLSLVFLYPLLKRLNASETETIVEASPLSLEEA